MKHINLICLITVSLLIGCNRDNHAMQIDNKLIPASVNTEIGKVNKKDSSNIRVLSYTYAPFVVRGNGEILGLETDILKAIGEKQNIQFDFQTSSPRINWVQMFDYISSGKMDLLSAGMYANYERRERFEVSDSYMDSKFAFFSINEQLFNKFSDLKGKKLAVMQNSMASKEIDEFSEHQKIHIEYIQSIYEGVQAVLRGEVDALYADKTVLQYYQKELNQVQSHVNINSSSPSNQFVFLITKGNIKLLEKVNTGLAQIKQDGTLEKIKQKWLASQN